MNEPLLSIIVPVYKVETYLAGCIESILGQSFGDFELILVDDGSPDRCGTICDEYARKDRRIKVIHKANGGLSSARNAGIGLSTGRYLTFVDSDDTVSEDTYLKNLRVLRKDPSIDLLEFPMQVHYQSPDQYLLDLQENHFYGKKEIFFYWMKDRGYLHAYACNKIYKRKLFVQIRFPEGKTFEDLHTIPGLLELCDHYYVSPYGIYYYYSRPSSITRAASFNDHLCLLEANIQVMDISRRYLLHLSESLSVHYLYTVNHLIDLLRCKDGDNRTKERMFNRMNAYEVKFRRLMKLRIPWRMKLKNLPLALAGLKMHCTLYTGMFNPRHSRTGADSRRSGILKNQN